MRTDVAIALIIGATISIGMIAEAVEATSTNQKELEYLNKENAKLNDQILKLHDRLGAVEVERDSIKQDLERLQRH